MASSVNEERRTVLRSGDGEEFEVEETTVRQSSLLGDIINCCSENDIPVPNVDGKILAKVIEYCKKHAAATTALGNDGNATKRDDDMKKAWDAAFIDVDPAILHDLLLAAHFLVIKSLWNLTCEKVAADMVKGKSVEASSRTFNIKNDFTPVGEAEFKKQHQWAFE